MKQPPASAQDRALEIAARARSEAQADVDADRADRLQAAARLREEGPEFYAFAQAVRAAMPGAKVRYIRWEDGTEWREPCDAGLTAVQPSIPPIDPKQLKRKP